MMTSGRARELHQRGCRLPAALLAPHPDRLEADHPQAPAAVAAHADAVADGVDGYLDPISGMFCFTAAYHWEKGRCCELGCRHCPWLEADRRLAGPVPQGGHTPDPA